MLHFGFACNLLCATGKQPQVFAKQFVSQLGIGGTCGDPNVYLVPDQWLRQPSP